MNVSEVIDLREIVGRNVKAIKAFSGIPVGTVGKIVKYEKGTNNVREEIAVEWTTEARPYAHTVTDWFSRDRFFDETNYLELI